MTINLEPRLDSKLWAAIEKPYQGGDYTGAILDSIHFIGELIREKTGLEGDGVALVGQALGGQSPKLRITKLQTESEINVQKGFEQFLRGLYQAIRNPRSHEKYSDNAEEAEALILFVNYLVRAIEKAKGPFDKDAFLQQVFDPLFAENNRYATLLVDRIPHGKRWDVLLEVFGKKEEGRGQKLQYFFSALLETLSAEQKDSFCEIVSQELETTTSDATIRAILQLIPQEYWCGYSEIARIRTEGKLIESIKEGKYDRSSAKCIAGGLGTWSSGLRPHFVLKDRLAMVLAAKLGSSEPSEQDYVFAFFLPGVFADFPKPPILIVMRLKEGLKAGDARFRNALSGIDFLEDTDPWKAALKDPVASFVEAQDFNPGISDDDVPF